MQASGLPLLEDDGIAGQSRRGALTADFFFREGALHAVIPVESELVPIQVRIR